MAIDRLQRRCREPQGTARLLMLVAALVTIVQEVSACVNFTSTVDDAGDPGPGSDACLPYNVEVVAAAGTVLLSEASESATALAPAMDVSMLVDESASVSLGCNDTDQCYLDEKNFAKQLVTLLDDSVDFFSKGGTVQYIEYSSAVNVNQAFTNEADYLACK